MHLVVFGLTISSSWGNGHATLWRGLVRALARSGHRVTFFERDTPYYAGARDVFEIAGGALVIYSDWASVTDKAEAALDGADVAIVTSYCPDAISAATLILDDGGPSAVFYDLDSPVTLAHIDAGVTPAYIGPDGLAPFDLVLSYAGGPTLDRLQLQLGARRVAPLYGHVDPDLHRPRPRLDRYRADLSYLGTYSDDRQRALETLFIAAACRRPRQRFLLGGAQYPVNFPWAENIFFVRHLPPDEHPAFFSSSRLTLNVTRAAMARMGWCPSGRLFEASACGAAIVTDRWPGLESFFRTGSEVLVADDTEDMLAAIDLDGGDIAAIARAGRERTLDEHTSAHRARELIRLVERPPEHPPACDAATLEA